MKVIDLLNKIAKGEEVPKKIKYDGEFYELSKLGYYNTYSGADFLRKIMLDSFYLLKEIEVIEEDKKVEKIDVNYLQQIKKWKRAKVLGNKINEIIDKINKMEDK